MKRKMTMKGKLVLANAVMCLFLFICMIYEWKIWGNPPDMTLLRYVLIQCGFVFLSLIVNYLSIIADALEGKSSQQEKTGKQEKE